MSEVPLYPPRPKRAGTVPCGHVASRPPSDMPSTPAQLALPLTSAKGVVFQSSKIKTNAHLKNSACVP